MFVEAWQQGIACQSKLKFYSTIKTEFRAESYISTVSSEARKYIASIRSSAHDLNIERGRYTSKTHVPSLADKLCRHCHLNSKEYVENFLHLPFCELDMITIESEEHAIGYCPLYEHERAKLSSNLKHLVTIGDIKTAMEPNHAEEFGLYLKRCYKVRNPDPTKAKKVIANTELVHKNQDTGSNSSNHDQPSRPMCPIKPKLKEMVTMYTNDPIKQELEQHSSVIIAALPLQMRPKDLKNIVQSVKLPDDSYMTVPDQNRNGAGTDRNTCMTVHPVLGNSNTYVPFARVSPSRVRRGSSQHFIPRSTFLANLSRHLTPSIVFHNNIIKHRHTNHSLPTWGFKNKYLDL